MEIGEYFMIQFSMWSTNFFRKKKACCVPDQVRMGRDGVWLELVSQVVFWAFFEIWKPHVDHTKFPEFYTFILDNNPVVR